MASIVSGLYYIEHVDTDGVLAALDQREWKPVTHSQNSRKIQHYGFTYNYVSRKVATVCEPIPAELEGLKRLVTEACVQRGLIDATYEFNQCIVNDYQPGQGIAKHADVKAYGPVIGCVTLESGADMTFRRDNETYTLYTEPNSLYIMSGEARYRWTHEMAARKSDVVEGRRVARGRRVSVTFRNVTIVT